VIETGLLTLIAANHICPAPGSQPLYNDRPGTRLNELASPGLVYWPFSVKRRDDSKQQ